MWANVACEDVSFIARVSDLWPTAASEANTHIKYIVYEEVYGNCWSNYPLTI